ncbi:glycerol kinase GlpK [Hujiaoplasma nucleasis]|uniref:Glycerol kinase n=1 Tax=Hujiaoplasma nucleasis TaxID=2725268 RepID=A0A7L6N8K9_9MOLU|nr:glycerol kinase GlpK [Hujiaoplasma nucleasis]QLY40859.1 glycerol kinase GlpK [Hujiaoplasma nucleasis]
MKKYILAIDQGTTSTRAIIFDKKSKIISIANKEITQFYPKPGWVEQDANEIWLSVISTITQALVLKNILPNQIDSIGITNQRETTVIWDKESGEPIYNAVVWQSRQSQDICDQLEKSGYEDKIRQKTGLLIDPYFSGTKIKWILDHVKGSREKAKQGKLAFGTIDSWLIYKLTGYVHKTDYSNASRTLIYNIHNLKWDDELLDILDIPKSILPEVVDSSGLFGYTTPRSFYGEKIKITGVAGDQQASLFGQLCSKEGMVNSTYGTGCFVLMNTGNQIVQSKNGMLSTIAWKIKDQIIYALEGSVFVGGSSVQWLRDGLKIIASAAETEKLAESIPSTDGVYVVPAFVGLGTPYWDSDAKGAIFGLTRGTDERQLARATLEAIAYQVMDVLKAMEADSKKPIPLIKATGGATINQYLMQFQADIMNIDVGRPEIMETTALGAAYLAGLESGYWKNIDEINQHKNDDDVFKPKMSEAKRKQLIKGWKMAVEATRFFKP